MGVTMMLVDNDDCDGGDGDKDVDDDDCGCAHNCFYALYYWSGNLNHPFSFALQQQMRYG